MGEIGDYNDRDKRLMLCRLASSLLKLSGSTTESDDGEQDNNDNGSVDKTIYYETTSAPYLKIPIIHDDYSIMYGRERE